MLNIFLFFFSLVSFSKGKPICQTSYDQLDIPHVEVQSIKDFYYCIGLHHGEDRAWQMDYFRRVAMGRNAEVLGFSHLKSDLMMRLLDLPSEAEKLWSKFPLTSKDWLESYALGVNKGFQKGKKSKEFIDADYTPEKWLPAHTIMILMLQSFDQTRRTFFKDYEEERQKEKWGKRAAILFEEDHLPWENTILKDGEYEKKQDIVKTTSYHQSRTRLWANFPSVFGLESGSNNWVVSKSKSKNGHPLLANDPHLDLKTPLFWYWISLKSSDFKVIGATLPGVPIIVSGTNGKVAWGLTNSYLNSADAIFVSDLKSSEIETFRPVVYVKWWKFKIPFFFKSFEKLKSGYKILPLEVKSPHKLVLRWSGFHLDPHEISPMLDIFKVSHVKEMDQFLSSIGLPSWNFVFSDVHGDIGYRLVGKTFKEVNKTSPGIPVMTREEFTNPRYLEKEHRPHLLNPSRGYIYSANNRHWPSDSKFYGGRGYSQSYRGFRIDELLKEEQDVESFKKIQCDRQVVDAKFFLPKIKKYIDIPEFNNSNMVAEDSSRSLPYYRRLMDLMMEEWEVNENGLYRLLNDLSEEQKKTLMELKSKLISEIKGRDWGTIHKLNFPHISGNPDWKFSPEIAGVGDTHSVDPGTASWNQELGFYQQSSGASMRMIVELGKETRIWLSLPGVNREYHVPKTLPWLDWKSCKYSELSF
jgi:penicillin amidase